MFPGLKIPHPRGQWSMAFISRRTLALKSALFFPFPRYKSPLLLPLAALLDGKAASYLRGLLLSLDLSPSVQIRETVLDQLHS